MLVLPCLLPMWMAPGRLQSWPMERTHARRGRFHQDRGRCREKGRRESHHAGAGLSQPNSPPSRRKILALPTAAAQARATAARQVQIDTLTNKPGRGGTILTDSYQYRV